MILLTCLQGERATKFDGPQGDETHYFVVLHPRSPSKVAMISAWPNRVWLFTLHTAYLASAFGINCRGSSECLFAGSFLRYTNVVQAFVDVLEFGSANSDLPGGPISPTSTYLAGQHIVCAEYHGVVGSICLFLQGNVPTAGVSGSLVIRKLNEIYCHGCEVCGSVPLSDSNNNPDTMGELTMNYVLHAGCNGLCSQPGMRISNGSLPTTAGNITAPNQAARSGTCIIATAEIASTSPVHHMTPGREGGRR